MDDDLDMEIKGDDGDVEITDIDLGKEGDDRAEVVETYFANIDGVSPVPDGDSMAFDLTISVTKSSDAGVEVRHTIRRISVNAQSLFDKAEQAEDTTIVVEGKAKAAALMSKRALNEMRQLAGLEPIHG